MEIRNRVDPVRIGEELVYSIFHHVFHDEGARRHFGFAQINFFNSTEGLPGWNVWLEDTKGAYQLVLVYGDEGEGATGFPVRDDSHGGPAGTVVEGRFLIRYFPDIDDPLLDRFSCGEALLRYGSVFDHTGTPSLAGQDSMEEGCFVVGYLDFTTTTGREFVELRCIAPTRWRDVRPDGLYLDVPGDERYEAVAPGDIDRDVPGWDLAFHLFDRLTTAFGYVHQTTPRGALLTRKQWVRFEVGTTTCSEKIDAEVYLLNLVVGFATKSGGTGCRCGHPDGAESYLDGVADRMHAAGFNSVETSLKGNESADSFLKKEWWSAGRMSFSTDAESEMQHCCYHDH